MKQRDQISCSLVITTYNSPDTLDLSIRSVLRQSELPCEIIVADDGSTSDTAMLVDALRASAFTPIVHVWQEDKGFRAAAARNKAIAEAKGNYIVIVDGDMLLHPDFIRDHKALALEGSFIQGSRVWLSQENTFRRFISRETAVSIFEPGLENRKSALHLPLLTRMLDFKSSSLGSIKSCNMSFFRNDCILANGFNEDFIGWGREDSEFVVRLINRGIFRRNIRYSAIAAHLWHPENQRRSLTENDRLLQQAIDGKLTSCRNGIDKYLVKR